MSMAGKTMWDEFHEKLGFPSYKTVRRWKKEEFQRIGFDKNLFDGSIENIQRLFKMFVCDNFQTKRTKIVLAIDAVGVKPNVIIHKDGRIEGLIEDLKIDIELASEIRKSSDAFYSFINANNEDIIADFFIVFSCPLESKKGGFPLLVMPKNNGSADVNLVGIFEEIYYKCEAINIEVLGLAFDGDSGYLKYVKAFCEKINYVDIFSPLPMLFSNLGMPLIFEDLMHLIKCIRYRLVSGSNICVFPD